MKSFAAVALLAGSAMAGNISGLTFPNNFPSCGNVCVSQTIGTSDCFSSGDLKGCACKLLDPANYAKDPCIRDNCSPDDVRGVISGVQSACGGKANAPPQTSSKQQSSSSAAAQQTSAAQPSSAAQQTSTAYESSTVQASSSAGSVTASLQTSIIPSTGASQASKTDAATGASKTSASAAQPTKSSSAAGVVVGGMAAVAALALAL